MRTKGALVWGLHEEWQVEQIDVGDPREGEVTVELAASGLCFSDRHIGDGDFPAKFFPILGGHEGAGVVTTVGPGVRGLAEGDHVVLGFIPSCGQCPPCSSGRQNLCDLGADLLTGKSISDGSYRVRARGKPVIPTSLLGTFSPYVTVHQASAIKIRKDVPLDKAALVGCGVTTGWGSATHVAGVRPGETVVVIGVGGVGINAVQGAVAAGAKWVIAIDPVAFKREQAQRFGATHTFASLAEALAPVTDLTWGRGAEKAVIAIDRMRGEYIAPALALVGKGGTCVVAGMGPATDLDVKLSLFELTLLQKTLKGAIFGGANPRVEIPWLLDMYREGKLKLDELVTSTYKLEDINSGYADMAAGRNLRGVVLYTDADR
ncbi:NDMA-dependent alcohol dehydrogenase [Frankia sp. Cas3]|uniref:NDMA-dependent alcohol dehydrogenase n=1 Tax=Frankia sp. Cas3 TaxID=3073926 RepID=UPI002AD3B513|nr:NDMA-dependent alcohol dehydrogenase [Frankia sp. Cas3]